MLEIGVAFSVGTGMSARRTCRNGAIEQNEVQSVAKNRYRKQVFEEDYSN